MKNGLFYMLPESEFSQFILKGDAL